jgi:hypothetical protein
MRPALLVSLVFIGLIALSVRHNHKREAVARVAFSGRTVTDNHSPNWKVEGDWMPNPEDAKQDALQKAQRELTSYLRAQRPPIEWRPPTGYVEKKLVRKLEVGDREFRAGVGDMVKYRLEIQVTPKERAEIQQLDREHRSRERMAWLGKVLAGLVTVLVAVASYVHLDERTRGYYNGLLRLGFAGLVAAVGAGLWWLA